MNYQPDKTDAEIAAMSPEQQAEWLAEIFDRKRNQAVAEEMYNLNNRRWERLLSGEKVDGIQWTQEQIDECRRQDGVEVERRRAALPAAERPQRAEPVHIFDWRTMPAGKPKYHAYLASRDWALVKQKIHARSGGKCEMCGNPANHVHHQTYERLYCEDLTDLLHLCAPCHEHLSGK